MRTQTMTIAATETTSTPISLLEFPPALDQNPFSIAGLIVPATDGTSLALEASFDDGATWHPMLAEDATAIALTTSAAGYFVLNPQQMMAADHIRVVSDAAETAQRTITAVFRIYE